LAQEALPHLEEARRVRKILFGHESMEVATTLYRTARLREAVGETDEALKDAKESLRICRANVGEWDSRTNMASKMISRLEKLKLPSVSDAHIQRENHSKSPSHRENQNQMQNQPQQPSKKVTII
jgi:hypothetical protein